MAKQWRSSPLFLVILHVPTRVLLCITLISLASLFFVNPISVRAENTTPVGVYYYPWYDVGFGERHWNDSVTNIVVDEPVYYSYYDSQNVTHVRRQIKLMSDIGMDFVIISWWGDNSYEDSATKVFIEANIAEAPPLKFCIFVEPYTESPNYTFIYNYVHNTYVQPYSSIYFKWGYKPLLCWFNPMNPPKNDTRFTDRVIGGMDYCDWSYWNKDAKVESDGYVVVGPRYDDYYLWLYGGRETYQSLDANYTEGMYDKQWQYVIKNLKKVKLVLICTWNEYHERTMIEPHKDYTASVNNSHIYLKTEYYIACMRDTTPPSIVYISSSPTEPEYHETVTVKANVTDEVSGVDTVILSHFDGAEWHNQTMSWEGGLYSATIPKLPYNTLVKYKVYVSDISGNWVESDTKNYTVTDTTLPSISIISPSAGSKIKISTVAVSWSGSDAGSGIDHYEIRLDQQLWVNVGTATNHTFTRVSDGEHKVIVKAIDKAGNVKESSVSFTVNSSLIGGPGWADDIPLFGVGIAAAVALILILRRRKGP